MKAHVSYIGTQVVEVFVKAGIRSLERINPHFASAHSDQFQDSLPMKRIIESVAVSEQKVPAEYEVKATILDNEDLIENYVKANVE